MMAGRNDTVSWVAHAEFPVQHRPFRQSASYMGAYEYDDATFVS